MSKDMMQGKLTQLRDAVKQRWGVLTDKDLDTVDEKLVQLPGLLQARYGYTREQAEKEGLDSENQHCFKQVWRP